MMKEKSWEEIATTCNISGIEVQQRWQRLKDRFSKQRRIIDHATRNGSAAQIIKQWPLFESMKFVDKHVQRRRTFTNVSPQFVQSQNNALKTLNFDHQNKRESTVAVPSNQNIAQIKQELKRIQSICSQSIQLKNQTQKMLSEDLLKKMHMDY